MPSLEAVPSGRHTPEEKQADSGGVLWAAQRFASVPSEWAAGETIANSSREGKAAGPQAALVC